MDFEIGIVSLDQIETDDRTFKITTNTHKTELALSIGTVGLLQPPVLMKKGRSFIVICGFRRIAACQTLNITRVPARILQSDVSKITCAQMAISDNSLQRPLNLVEQARAYTLVRRFVDQVPSLLKILEPTGLAFSQAAIDRIMPIAGMPVSLQNAILEGSIALPVALQINQMKDDDANALCLFFRELTTGLNVQRELLELISEIALRDDNSISRMMKQDAIASIMGNSDLTAPQKVRELRIMLKAKRYPELSKAEASYYEKVKSLKLNPRIQLQPPPFFEGNTYRLMLTVDSRRRLKFLQPELNKLVDHSSPLPE